MTDSATEDGRKETVQPRAALFARGAGLDAHARRSGSDNVTSSEVALGSALVLGMLLQKETSLIERHFASDAADLAVDVMQAGDALARSDQ